MRSLVLAAAILAWSAPADAANTNTLTVQLQGTGSGSVASTPAGIACPPTCSADFPPNVLVTLVPTASPGSAFVSWGGGGCGGTGICNLLVDVPRTIPANFNVAGVIVPSVASLDFDGQSMTTTSPERVVTISNGGGATLAVSGVTASAGFAATTNCATLPVGATCIASVTFTPGTEGTVNGTLTISGSVPSATVALSGIGERSLATHYYRSILRRAPDAPGKAFWIAEAARLQALGADANEAWIAMGTAFFSSAEYAGFGRDDLTFTIDLYAAFLNRFPDTAGRDYWTAQLAAGLPREVALPAFLFSPEFASFTQALFGSVPVRPEVNLVGDFYRGLLGRLPDDSGFAFWRTRFRVAQCSGAVAVTQEAEAISSLFAQSGEAAARARTNAQFVGDLYNAFLRRGGELAGVRFWIDALDAGTLTREQVRQQFVASPEFQGRVAAVIAAGCLP